MRPDQWYSDSSPRFRGSVVRCAGSGDAAHAFLREKASITPPAIMSAPSTLNTMVPMPPAISGHRWHFWNHRYPLLRRWMYRLGVAAALPGVIVTASSLHLLRSSLNVLRVRCSFSNGCHCRGSEHGACRDCKSQQCTQQLLLQKQGGGHPPFLLGSLISPFPLSPHHVEQTHRHAVLPCVSQ